MGISSGKLTNLFLSTGNTQNNGVSYKGTETIN